MVGYYPLEYLLWVAHVAPKLVKADLDKVSRASYLDKVSRVSCVFWVAWLLLELVATYLRFKELDKIQKDLEKGRSLTPADRVRPCASCSRISSPKHPQG